MAQLTKNSIKGLVCPFCKNDNIVVFLDFKKGKQGSENFAVCQKKVIKGVFGPRTKGCDKKFKVDYANK